MGLGLAYPYTNCFQNQEPDHTIHIRRNPNHSLRFSTLGRRYTKFEVDMYVHRRRAKIDAVKHEWATHRGFLMVEFPLLVHWCILQLPLCICSAGFESLLSINKAAYLVNYLLCAQKERTPVASR